MLHVPHSSRAGPNARDAFASFVFVLPLALLSASPGVPAPSPTVESVQEALREATGFFAGKAALQGGYQRAYSVDLSYANAGKGAEGLTQISVTGGTTPAVGHVFLRAWKATGEDLYLEAARAAAYALIAGQLCSGGWDYTIELDPEKRAGYHYRIDGECPAVPLDGRENRTNLDNNTTQAALRFMMRMDRALEHEDAPIRDATKYALECLVRAQYPNGAWPQRYDRFPDPAKYPVKAAAFPDSWSREWPGTVFYSHYTFNDEVAFNSVDVLLEASRLYERPHYRAAAEKAGDFMLLAQFPEPQPGWAQQYDTDMHPAWGRIFEPPGVTGRESLAVMDALLFLYRETGKKKYLEPLPRAFAYLRRSAFEHNGRQVIARFFEIKTNKPLFVTRGTLVGTRVNFGRPTDGYEVTYDPDQPAAHYGYFGGVEGIDNVQREYDRVRTAEPASLRRADGLTDMYPRRSPPPPPPSAAAAELAPRVAAAIAALDERGAWVTDGDLGGPGRLVRVRARQDLVAVIDGKVVPVPDGSTLEVYEGTAPPEKRLISSGVFASNVQLFLDYLAAQPK